MKLSLTETERRIFRKREIPPVSRWAAQHLIVPDGPYAGARYRRDVNPYLAGIMDAFSERSVEEVVVCGAPQTGKTLCLYACLCWCIDYRPAPRMLAMPDDETLARVVEAKLKPMFRKTRPVRELLGKSKGGRTGFADGTALYLSSAASASQRASISVQDLFLDEESLFRAFAGHGDPVTDFRERTRSYPYTRKIMRISKPVGDETTTIWADLAAMDEVRRYRVVCPACGTEQVMQPENIISEHGVKDPVRVRREKLGRYRCPHCAYHWTDYARDQAVARGRWEADNPLPFPHRVGFHLPAYLSAAVSLSEIRAAQLELEKTDDADAHQAYANGMLAMPYTPVIAKTSEAEVLELVDRELVPCTVPAGYRAVTLGIDMQKVGFWYMAVAWTGRLDGAVIDYGRLQDWEDVYRKVFETEYAVQGQEDPVPVWRAALDTGGGLEGDAISRTEQAYDFLRRYGMGVLWGTKGASHRQSIPVHWTLLERMPQSRTAIPGGLRLYLIDTDYFKTWTTARLQPGSRQPFRLHAGCDGALVRQLTAEQLVREKGKRVWKQRRRDNHWFDCLCLCTAAAHSTWTPSLSRILEAVEEEEPAFAERKGA